MKKILSSILIIVLTILVSIPIWKQVIQEFSSNDYKTFVIKNNNTRNYDYEHYCDSIYEVNPDYYLDVLIETDKFQSYINEHGEWWINSSIVKENKD